jgi:hypothetical protein
MGERGLSLLEDIVEVDPQRYRVWRRLSKRQLF